MSNMKTGNKNPDVWTKVKLVDEALKKASGKQLVSATTLKNGVVIVVQDSTKSGDAATRSEFVQKNTAVTALLQKFGCGTC